MSGYSNSNKPWRGGNDRNYYHRNRHPPPYPPGRPPWPDQMNQWSSRPPHGYYQHPPNRPYHRNQRYGNFNNFNRNDAMLPPPPPPVPPQEDFTELNIPEIMDERNQGESTEAPEKSSEVSEVSEPVSLPVVGSKKTDKLPEHLDRSAIKKLVNSTTRYEPQMQKLLREQRSQLTQNLRNKYNETSLPNSTVGEEPEVIPNFTMDLVEELQFLTKVFDNNEEEEKETDVKQENIEEAVKEEISEDTFNLGSIDIPSNLENLELPSDDSFFNFSEINKDMSTIETTTLSPIKPKDTPEILEKVIEKPKTPEKVVKPKETSKGKKGKKKKKKKVHNFEKKTPTKDPPKEIPSSTPVVVTTPVVSSSTNPEEETTNLRQSLDKFRLTLRSEILKTRAIPKVTKTEVARKKPEQRASKSKHKKHLNNPENVDKILSELEAEANKEPEIPKEVEKIVEPVIPDRVESPLIEPPQPEIQNRKWRSPGEKKYMSTITPVEQPESTKDILLKLYKIDLAIQQLLDEKMQLYSKLNVNNNYEEQYSLETAKRKEPTEPEIPPKRSKRLSTESPIIKPCVVSLVSIDVEKYEATKSKLFCKDHTGSILFIKVFKNSIVIAAGEDGNVYKYDLLTGQLLGLGKGHVEAVTSLVIVNKSKHFDKPVIYTGSLDSSFRAFDLETMNPCPVSENVECAIQSMDSDWGYIFIGTKSGYIHKYSLEFKRLEEDRRYCSNQSILVIRTCREGGRRVLLIAPRNEPVSVRDAMTGLLLRYVSSTTMKPTIFSILLLDSVVYCGTSQKAITGYDFTNGDAVTELTAGRGVVCLTEHNKLVYAGCYDGQVYVFDSKSKHRVVTVPGLGNMVLSLDVTDTKIVIGCKNSHLVIMDIPEEIKNFKCTK